MTTEYLLNAIGLIDDDLLAAAEALPPSRRRWRPSLHSLQTLAACLAVVTVLGLGVNLLSWRTGSKSTSAGGGNAAPSAASSQAGQEIDGQNGGSTSDSCSIAAAAPEPTPSDIEVVQYGLVYVDSQVYSISRFVDELPQDCALIGTLEAADSTEWAASCSTDVEDYVGCSLWRDEADVLYIQLPDGGCAAAELVEP